MGSYVSSRGESVKISCVQVFLLIGVLTQGRFESVTVIITDYTAKSNSNQLMDVTYSINQLKIKT